MMLLEDGEAKTKQLVLYQATDGSDCVLLLEDGEAKPKQLVLYQATDGSDCVLLRYGLTLIRQTKPT